MIYPLSMQYVRSVNMKQLGLLIVKADQDKVNYKLFEAFSCDVHSGYCGGRIFLQLKVIIHVMRRVHLLKNYDKMQ